MQSELILIVDDEAMIRVSLRATLSNIGFKTLEAGRGEEALALVRTNRVDAVLLDINMPGMNGIDVCKNIRSLRPRLAILMLTVRDGEDDIVTALDSGADDYITKPFQLRELTARLRSAVRRRTTEDANRDSPIRHGNLELDPVRYRVQKRGRSIHLTPKEFEVLHYLMMHAGEPVPHARLLKSVWGPEYGNELEYLRTFVRLLRKKIEDDPQNPQYLVTDAYVGYRFNEQQPET